MLSASGASCAPAAYIKDVKVGYETYGTLNTAGNNAVFVANQDDYAGASACIRTQNVEPSPSRESKPTRACISVAS